MGGAVARGRSGHFHSRYHRHGAYLTRHSDLPGFSWQEQRLSAVLIRGHRRRFPTRTFKKLPKKEARTARRLCLLLRLAVLLHRGRWSRSCRYSDRSRQAALAVALPRGWLAKHPLTREDLEQEAEYLRTAGWRLRFT